MTVATIVLAPDERDGKVTVRATYSPVIEHHDVYVYEYAVPATWEGDAVVVVGAPFFAWAHAPHDAYVHEEWIAVHEVVVTHKRHKHKHHKHHRVEFRF